MNLKLLLLGFAIICFGIYTLYDDYNNWSAMKEKNKGQLYKSVLFGILLVAVAVFIIIKGLNGQNVL